MLMKQDLDPAKSLNRDMQHLVEVTLIKLQSAK